MPALSGAVDPTGATGAAATRPVETRARDPGEIVMNDWTVVWNGNVQAPSRGYLVTVPESVRPAPDLPKMPECRRWVSEERQRAIQRLQAGPVTCVELAALAGMHEDTVRHLLGELRDEGSLREARLEGQRRGRPQKLYWIA